MARADRGLLLRLRAAALAVLLALGLIGVATPAQGAEATVADAAGLKTALATTGTSPIILGGDITVTDNTLTVAIHTIIDLAGHTLTARNITLNAGRSMAITDSAGGGRLIATAPAGTTMAGIRTTGATLLIRSGTVTATGGSASGNGGAGIGGNSGQGSDTIMIEGGTVSAQGGAGAAGIGGGSGSGGAGGTIRISGGDVDARGGPSGPGIGSGSNAATAATVLVSGGTVTAHGGAQGAGIGGGSGSHGASLEITAGTVTATGGQYAAGVGGGNSRDGGFTLVRGGILVATGGDNGAGIGSGYFGAHGGTTTIRGGQVTAIGGNSGAGIGGGYDSNGGTVAIRNGTVQATGGVDAAGIGGGAFGDHGGSTTIEGGTVTAAGGPYAAGIGGGREGDGNTTTITGGTISATGGRWAAGIGGGSFAGAGGTTSIDGGTVTAVGGEGAAGVGGSIGGAGGAITLGEGAVLTASAAVHHIALGAGFGNSAPWSAQLGGELRLPTTGTLGVSSNATVNILPTGVVTGSGTQFGMVAGSGTISNAGSITLPTAGVFAPITGNNFLVTFDGTAAGVPTSTVRVFAPTFAAGARTIPTPAISGVPLATWSTAADDSGIEFTATTVLTGDLTVYSQPTTVTLDMTAPGSMVAGDTVALSVEGTAAGVSGDFTDELTFTSSEPTDAITGADLTATVAGNRTITATLTSDAAITTTTTVTVTPAPAATLTLTSSRTSVTVGDTITVGVAAIDAYGNSIPAATALTTFSSDNPNDTVASNTITFPTPGERTVTAALGAATASIAATAVATVAAPPSAPVTAPEGAAPAASLSTTGANNIAGLIAVGLLLLLGGTTAIATRKERTSS